MQTHSPSTRVAANVRAEMARTGTTQKSLASELKRTQQSLSLRLTGKVGFNIDELHEIAAVLGVDLSRLIGETKASA